ncbi:LegC family aminotransferase [Polaribacter sp.]|nr:LegC family aminotransferase [Polaribacter sp.]MDC1533634.1 LegC family aminotransferase [Polaribacter sp.]
MIPLSIPNINGNEWKYVKDCLDTGWISSAGEYVNLFEKAIKDYTGAKYAIACMNGTAGLEVSLNLAKVSTHDIVIAPNLTFVATLNAISYSGAEITLIDVCENTWQIDIDLLHKWLENNSITKIVDGKPFTTEKKSGKKIGAIMPVYVLGGFIDIDRLVEISFTYGIPLIEDSTEALGSFKNKKHAGTYGLTGVLSFNGNKIISTGGGGMILTNDKEIATRARHITTTAKTDPLDYFHDEVGYNYRLVNVLAAIGVAQMENFESILKRKKEIDALYRIELAGIGDIKFQENYPNSDPNCWLFTFRTKKMRELLNHLNSKKIQSRPFWTPMNNLPMYKDLKYIFEKDISNKIFKECISIPSSSNLTIEDQHKVITEIKTFYKQ